MSRKTATYCVEDKGRDQGKTFLLTEMSAARAEDWAMRALFALMKGNVDVPEDFATLGMAGMAEMGLKAIGNLSYDVAKPLIAEMFECVQIIIDPAKMHVGRPLVENSPNGDSDDIEEIATRLKLRLEVFKLHTDFLQAAVPSIFPGKGTAAKPQRVVRTSRA
jgi:hypothetical protein